MMDDSDVFIAGSPNATLKWHRRSWINKLALSKFANAHSMAFLEMVLLLGSMIFDQIAYIIESTVTHSRARFSTTHFAD